MSEAYIITDTVRAIEEKKARFWRGGVGAEAKFEEVSVGWFITIGSSHESIFIGDTKPEMKVGDLVTIRISFNGRQ